MGIFTGLGLGLEDGYRFKGADSVPYCRADILNDGGTKGFTLNSDGSFFPFQPMLREFISAH